MKLSPANSPAPQYPLLTAALAGAAALSLSACTTCPSCDGSGLQVYTERGIVPPSAAHHSSFRSLNTAPCIPCGGSGRRPLWGQQPEQVLGGEIVLPPRRYHSAR